MEKQFVTYEIALKLKELGFDEECFGRYEGSDYYLEKWNEVKLEPTHTTSQNTFSWQLASAPLWQQVIDWFREKHKIRVCNLVNIYIEATFIIYHSTDVEVIDGNDFYKTREQAILKAIELCQKEK